MITTREINVILKKAQRKFIGITTKNVDASIRTPLPAEKPVKSSFVSTHNQADAADIAEKKRRDEIMKERYDLEKIKEARRVIMTEQKATEIMSGAVEQGKETIEALTTELNNAMDKEKKKELLALKKKDAKEKATKKLALKKQKDKERMAKVRAAKKNKK